MDEILKQLMQRLQTKLNTFPVTGVSTASDMSHTIRDLALARLINDIACGDKEINIATESIGKSNWTIKIKPKA